MTKFYTGIGSREAPPEAIKWGEDLGFALAKAGYGLRSGAADGMDTAFEDGAQRASGIMRIFLAWKGFNGNTSPLYIVSPESMAMAATLHPAWERLGQGPRKLHARNCNQVLGETLDNPSEFTVCWTPDGCESEKARTSKTGGTATAIALSDRNGIPVFNLRNSASRAKLNAFLAERGINFALPLDLPPAQTALF